MVITMVTEIAFVTPGAHWSVNEDRVDGYDFFSTHITHGFATS